MNIKDFRAQYPEYENMRDSDLASALHSKFYSDIPKEVFNRQFFGEVDHDNLERAAVTAKDSLQLQNIDPKIKPVVVGTPQEILKLKRDGQIGRDKVFFQAVQGKAYVIDPKGVQAIYGGSLAGSIKKAKMDILKGNDSILLGYPDRTKGNADVIVNKQGDIVTDISKISDEANQNNIAYGAQGSPEELLAKAAEVSQAIRLKTPRKWKTIGGDDEGDNEGREGNAIGQDAEGEKARQTDGQREVNDLQQGEAPQVTGGRLRPAVLHKGQQLTGADRHDDILEDHGLNLDEGARGFQTPEGKFLSRQGGMNWLEQFQPEVRQRLKELGIDELHSADLEKAYS